MTRVNQITYRDMGSSTALNAVIEKRLKKLERFCSDIKSTHIVLESPHNHKHKGKEFRITLEIDLKGNSITISQEDPSIRLAVRDAFNVAERKVKSYIEQLNDHRSERRQIADVDDLIDSPLAG